MTPSLHSTYGHSFKNLNKRIIIDMIRFTPGGISRAELARQMDLTRAAVTTIINNLMADRLVRETDDAPSAGGRRPILLEINPDRAYVMGIDMGATHLGIVLSDFSAHIIDEIELPFWVNDGPPKCLGFLDEQVRGLLDQANLKLEQIVSVGIGVPGPVVEELGAVNSPPIMLGWNDYPIRHHLSDLWKCPVSVGNDANFGALGEWAYGAGRGEENLAYIKVGSGVGAGLLLNGQMYRGTTGCAGEIGHITIRDDGPRCSCGSFGCLESMAGGNAVAQRAREAVNAGKRTKLASIIPLEKITARDVAAAARAGDLVAQQIITTSGNYLGIAIASLVNLFNPGMIVVGGGVAEMGDLLLDPIRQAVRERSLRSAGESVRVSTAVLGRRSSSIGAIVQAINAALDNIMEK